MKKVAIVLLALILLIGVGSFCGYRYLYQDMTGVPYSEIEAYQAENPYVNISYTVTIDGGSAPMLLTHETTSVTVESIPQTKSLIEQSAYLQAVTDIELGSLALTAEELDELQNAFANAAINHSHINILGNAYALNVTEIDLSMITADQIDSIADAIKPLTALKAINLMTADNKSSLSIDDVLKLQEACPNIHFNYEFELLGQNVTTDAESLIWERTYIGDQGLDQIRKILPIMYNLNYLKLDDCGTTDDAMAQLRTDFPNIEIHWRIFYSVFDCMTDNYKLWSIWGLMDKQIGPFEHLRGIRYMDLGHNNFTHLRFLKNLKDLDTLILAHGMLEETDGIQYCTNLTFLEIFSNRKLENDDMQNLAPLVNMEYLNISNLPLVTDLSFTDNMPKLKKLWCTLSNIPQEEVDRVKALHPDCEIVVMSQGDPTDFGWRTNPDGSNNARYALLREQIGYARNEVSQWPKGELKTEVTYESTGITPDE